MKSHSLSDRHAEPAGFKRSDVDAGVVVLAGHGGVDRKASTGAPVALRIVRNPRGYWEEVSGSGFRSDML